VNCEARTARVLRAIEATVAGDTSAVTELFTEDVVACSPMVATSSRVELAVELEDGHEAFSDIEVTAGGCVVAVEDRVCAEWVATATHTGLLALPDGALVPATDRRVTLRGVTVAEFAGDQICAVRHYWDEMELLAGLGLLAGT
jgi:hypothetical protein